MSAVVEALTEFQKYARDHITGDEKGEAQVFLDRLFIAFGHKGHKEAGANLFYVCCSRAQDKLIVADLGTGSQAKIEALFGNASVAM